MSTPRYMPTLVVDVPSGRLLRLSWQEFGVVLVAAALTVFFTVRGEPIHLAVAYAAGATLVPLGLFTVPRAVREYIRGQQLVHAAAQALTLEQQR
jgi:hypothetical protein